LSWANNHAFRGHASTNLENEKMGELIAFKPARRRARLRATPGGPGTVVFFTGVRQERFENLEYASAKAVAGRRAGKVPVRRSGKRKERAGAGPKA
jgi:hypothetical protein